MLEFRRTMLYFCLHVHKMPYDCIRSPMQVALSLSRTITSFAFMDIMLYKITIIFRLETVVNFYVRI